MLQPQLFKRFQTRYAVAEETPYRIKAELNCVETLSKYILSISPVHVTKVSNVKIEENRKLR